ncbi:MAG: hypothetical protein IT376_16745 [Polyangiaceae bacterium]|nr:hypothetical protein [Polyangiaceae bacterium]
MRGVDVETLGCPRCGAACRAGAGAAATCAHCGGELPLPAHHVAGRVAERHEARSAADLGALYARLGSPPGLALRAWGTAAHLLAWPAVAGFRLGARLVDPVAVLAATHPIALALFGVPLAIVIASFFGVVSLLRLSGPLLGLDVVDVAGVPTCFLALAVGSFVLGGVPLAVLRRADQLASARVATRAALAARPSHHAGGGAACRHCGGDLVVPAAALGVRCPYCDADNLVALPARELRRLTDQRTEFHLHVEDALVAEAAGRRDAGRQALRAAVGWAFGSLLIAVLGIVLQSAVDGHGRAAADAPFTLSPRLTGWFGDERNRSWQVPVQRDRALSLLCNECAWRERVSARTSRGASVPITWTALPDDRYSGRVVPGVTGWLVVSGLGESSRWRVERAPAR